MQLTCLCSQFFFFSSFELYITMYLGKFTLPRIPSHDDITLFLAHWVGNFSTISLNQICCLLSLNTFQNFHNNKCQSIQTVICFLKIKLSSACIIQDEKTNNWLFPWRPLNTVQTNKWQKSKKFCRYTINISDQCQHLPTYPSPNRTTINC